MKIYDNFNLLYKKPFGAVKINEVITIRIAVESFKQVTSPYLFICEIDKWHEFLCYPMTFEKNDDDFNWYVVEFSIPKPAVHFYFFKLNIDGIDYELKRGQNYESILSSSGDFYQLTVYENNFNNDEDYKGGIMYQIFPDRFCNSGLLKGNIPSGRELRQDWGGVPEYLPDCKGDITNNDYFCGDLKGVISKLDYLQELNVSCIYFNPIFEAHSNHRYDTANYMQIDPLLGTDYDFKELCSEAKKRGIVVILDGVFSHTGSDSIYFNKSNRYNVVGAYNSKESKYYSWYKFINYPYEYRSWWGFSTLPELDKENPDYVEYICGENGVIHKWLEAGAYGFRLDVVDELTKTFLERIKQSVIKYGGKILIGEVWEEASAKRSYGELREYLLGHELDSTMNYPFRDAIIEYVRYGNSKNFYETVMKVIENYPKEVVDNLMNMLSTHDVERVMTKLVAEEVGNRDRYWQANNNKLDYDQFQLGKKLLKLASIIQYFLPGLPCVYYGDEVGLFGYKDPFNRSCYPWGKEDTELLSFFKEIGKLRRDNKMLKEAYFRIHTINSEICVFERFNEEESIIVAINRTNEAKRLEIAMETLLEYEEIAKFGQYEDFMLNGYGSVVLKRK